MGLTTRALAALLSLEAAFVLLWNSGFIAAEYGLPYAGPWTLLFWRYLVLTAVLGGWLSIRGRLRWIGRAEAAHAAAVGVLAHGVWLSCVLVAIDLAVPAGIVALVTALQPLLTGALSGPVLGEHTDRRQWVGLLLGFAGVVIAVTARMTGGGDVSPWAYVLPFGSVIAITVASLMQRRRELGQKRGEVGQDVSLFYQSSATAVALLLPAMFLESFATQWTAPFLATMAWLIFAVSLGAYWAMWRLLARADATRVASLFYLSPPVTMLMAWAVFGDQLIATDLAGLVVAAAGVALVYRSGSAGGR